MKFQIRTIADFDKSFKRLSKKYNSLEKDLKELLLQLQENPQVIKGDLAGEINVGDGTWTDEIRDAYADRVVNQICEEIPNLRSLIKAQINLGPADLERMNVNLVGGDPYAGDCRIDQYAAWRPLSSATGHRTPVKNVWHIGASTHPGPGLGGGSGFLVANRLLGRK
jgi:phytoene dehydrogenase-like protein